LAYESVIRFIRAEQHKRGFTQPQFWILRHLSPHDLSPDGEGMTLLELNEAMAEYLRPEDDLAEEAERLLSRGLVLRAPDGNLFLTDEGEAARLEWKAHAPEIRALVHEGIDEADYATTIEVLKKLISNTSSPLAD
jgi:DNA-binding MarR family transcriptional regulator